jgi:hypothetical protein
MNNFTLISSVFTVSVIAFAMNGCSASGPTTWEKDSRSIQVFASSDILPSTVDAVERTLDLAMTAWGNAGPVEYWILGSSQDAQVELLTTYCSVRAEKRQKEMSDCLSEDSQNEDYGLSHYLNVGVDALESGSASSEMGRNGYSEWGFHGFTSSLPLGLEGLLNVSPEDDVKGIFHEYFHAVQHGSFSPNVGRDEADELMGPIWFVEGGAEFMAQTELQSALQRGEILPSGDSPFPWPGFENQMAGMLLNAKTAVTECPRLSEIGYDDSCSGYAYDGGAWAHALLAEKAGPNALVDVFYPQLEERGWEGAFLATYGITPADFMFEVEAFFILSDEAHIERFPWLAGSDFSPPQREFVPPNDGISEGIIEGPVL